MGSNNINPKVQVTIKVKRHQNSDPDSDGLKNSSISEISNNESVIMTHPIPKLNFSNALPLNPKIQKNDENTSTNLPIGHPHIPLKSQKLPNGPPPEKKTDKKMNKSYLKSCTDWFAGMFFFEFSYLFKKKDIEEKDLKDLPKAVTSENILSKFDEIYEIEYRRKKGQIAKKIPIPSSNKVEDLDSSINPLNQSIETPKKNNASKCQTSLGGNINMGGYGFGTAGITESMIQINPESQHKVINEKRLDTKIMMKTIFKIIFSNLWKSVIYSIISTILKISLPFIMKIFLDKIENDEPIKELIIWVILATFVSFMDGVITEHSIFNTCGCKARTGQILRAVFFRKIERTNYSFLKITDNSFINKMVLYELEHIVQFVGEIPKLITSPITLVLALFYIYQELHLLVFVVFAVFIVCVVLLNILKRRSVSRLRKYFALESKKSARISECIPQIQNVKLNGLENYFASKLLKIRKKEGRNLMKLHVYDAFSDAIFEGTPLFCSILIIGIMAVADGGVEASSAFAAITVLELLGDPLDALANSFDRIEAYSSARRSFRLFLEEVPEKILSIQPGEDFPKGKIEIKNCNFDFVDEKQMVEIIDQMMGEELAKKKGFKLQEKKLKKIKTMGVERVTRQETKELIFSGSFRSHSLPSLFSRKKKKKVLNLDGTNHIKPKYVTMLHNINVTIQPGQKVCLVGKPGSGFSEFLLSLMSESKISNDGIMNIRGEMSYLNVRMSNFVLGTIKNNIILNGKYDPVRFKKIISKLKINLSRLKGEEYFEILEGAKNISIDLQRKILLARWVYQEKDIYLMDDLFDDLNVAEWNMIYRNLIMDELKDKTVIFMSYTNLQIKVADHIIMFDNGQIIEQGNYLQMLSDTTSELRKVVLQDNHGGDISLLGRLMEGQKKSDKFQRSKGVFLRNNPFDAIKKATEIAKTLKARIRSRKLGNTKKRPINGEEVSKIRRRNNQYSDSKKETPEDKAKSIDSKQDIKVNPMGLPLHIKL